MCTGLCFYGCVECFSADKSKFFLDILPIITCRLGCERLNLRNTLTTFPEYNNSVKEKPFGISRNTKIASESAVPLISPRLIIRLACPFKNALRVGVRVTYESFPLPDLCRGTADRRAPTAGRRDNRPGEHPEEDLQRSNRILRSST